MGKEAMGEILLLLRGEETAHLPMLYVMQFAFSFVKEEIDL
jgi:hypothetical protein